MYNDTILYIRKGDRECTYCSKLRKRLIHHYGMCESEDRFFLEMGISIMTAHRIVDRCASCQGIGRTDVYTTQYRKVVITEKWRGRSL